MDNGIFTLAVAGALGLVVSYVFQTGPLLAGLLSAAAYLLIHTTTRTTNPYPPGPHGWPFIGNLLQIPQVAPWLVYSAWADKYGSWTHLYHVPQLTAVQAMSCTSQRYPTISSY